MIKDASELLLPSFQPCFLDKHYYTWLPAGRASGKSVDVTTLLILDMITDGRVNCICFRLYHKDHTDSTFQEFKKTINRIFGENTDKFWKFNESPAKLLITYLPFGNVIAFRGFTETTSIKGTTIGKGWYCRFWLEEAQQIINEEDFNAVDKSFRGELGEGMYPKWYITFNSPYQGHWLQKRIENAHIKVNFPKDKYITEGYEHYTYKSISDKKGNDELSIAIYSVYTENPFLTELDIKKFEADKYTNRQNFEQEMLGEFLARGKAIYTNWEVREMNLQTLLKPLPGEPKRWRAICGLDWGYVDPTAFIATVVNKKTREIYIYDEMYETELTGTGVAGRIISKGYGGSLIITDSARKDLIKEIKNAGIKRAKGVKKYSGNGVDSIEYSISKVQKYKIYVHPKCENMIRELNNYSWKKNTDGTFTNVPIDAYNHLCDACMVGDTKVLTKDGYREIKDIKENDILITFNEETKKFEYDKVVEAGKTKENAKIMELELNDGTKIRLTPDHRILTKRGWIEAKDLTEKDEVICYDKSKY